MDRIGHPRVVVHVADRSLQPVEDAQQAQRTVIVGHAAKLLLPGVPGLKAGLEKTRGTGCPWKTFRFISRKVIAGVIDLSP